MYAQVAAARFGLDLRRNQGHSGWPEQPTAHGVHGAVFRLARYRVGPQAPGETLGFAPGSRSSRTARSRAEAADEESLRRIQDLLTSRLQKFGRREHLTVHWQDLGG